MASVSSSTSSAEPQPCGRERSPTAKELLHSRSNSGEMDWKTLGNIVTASTLGEALCASYADFKYGRMHREFRPDIEWKFAYEENDVLIFKRTTKKSSVCFMGRGVIDLPLREVASFISNIENYHLWNRFMVEAKLVKNLSESDTHKSFLGYFVHESKRCFVKTRRDFLMFLHSAFIDGKFVHSAISVEHPLCPPVKGLVRAECCLGSGWVLEPYEGSESQTLATYIANVDLAIPLPPIMLNRVLCRQPLTIFYVREQLMQRHSLSPQDEPTNRRLSERISSEHMSEEHSSVSSSLEGSDQYVSSFFFVGYSASLKQYEEPMAIGDFMYQRRLSHSKPMSKRPPSVLTPAANNSGEGSKSSADSAVEIDTTSPSDQNRTADHGFMSSQHSSSSKRTDYRISTPTQSHQQQQFQTVL